MVIRCMNKLLAVLTACLFMLVIVPVGSSECIVYPKEDGPYNVVMAGQCLGMGGGNFTFWHLLPLWFLVHPLWFEWSFEPGSIFYVNGEKQEIVYPAAIHLYGFKGCGPTIYILLLKLFPLVLTGLSGEILRLPRARVLGQCAEIVVYDSQ